MDSGFKFSASLTEQSPEPWSCIFLLLIHWAQCFFSLNWGILRSKNRWIGFSSLCTFNFSSSARHEVLACNSELMSWRQEDQKIRVVLCYIAWASRECQNKQTSYLLTKVLPWNRACRKFLLLFSWYFLPHLTPTPVQSSSKPHCPPLSLQMSMSKSLLRAYGDVLCLPRMFFLLSFWSLEMSSCTVFLCAHLLYSSQLCSPSSCSSPPTPSLMLRKGLTLYL